MEILFIVYWVAAYWATNKIWWSKNTYIYPELFTGQYLN